MADYLSAGTGLLGNLPDWMLFGQGEEQNRPNAMLGGTPVQGVPNPMFGDRWQPAYDAAQSGQWFASDPSYPTPEQLAPRPGFPNSAPLPPPPAYPGANQYAGQSPTMAYALEQPKPQQPLANFSTSGPLTALQPTQVSVGGTPQPPPGPSGWDRFGQALNDNALTLMALGGGIASGRNWGEGIGRGLQGATAAAASERKLRREDAALRAFGSALKAKGATDAEISAAMANPEVGKQLMERYYPKLGSHVVNDMIIKEQPEGGYKPAAIVPMSEKDRLGLVQGVRKEIGDMPEWKRYQKSAPILNSMIKSYNDPSRMADVDYVYGMAQIFDPESVVREQEMVMVRNAQNLPDWLQGMINKVNGKQALGQDGRAALLNVAMTRVGEYQKPVDQAVTQFTNTYAPRGVKPEHIIPTTVTLDKLPEDAVKRHKTLSGDQASPGGGKPIKIGIDPKDGKLKREDQFIK